MKKVIIAGGREFNNYEYLKERCDIILKNFDPPIEIVSGNAPGADTLGERYSREYLFKEPTIFPARWRDIHVPGAVIRMNRAGIAYNVKAGHDRNELMAQYADVLIAFWDGKSTGTKDMIDRAMNHGLEIFINRYDQLTTS